jgi:hypothetical protein
MIWRAVAALTVIFWAVMSGLLVRDVYFPEASRFAVVPPRVVIDLFLRQSDSFGSQLHLYHHREKIGHASFQISHRITPNHQAVYDVLARGVVEQADGDDRRHVEASWSVACILADAERWQHLTLAADFPRRDASLKMSWSENQAAPEVLVKQGQRVVMNSQDVKMLLGGGQEGMLALLPMLTGGMAKPGAPGDAMKLHAREGRMVLAGRERKCFVLTLPVFGQHEVKMMLTEAGELSRIDLPDGYSLLEPTIHGLQESGHR